MAKKGPNEKGNQESIREAFEVFDQG